MGRRRTTRSRWQGEFESLLSDTVRPFLRQHGFTKSRHTFRRVRGPMYDMIGFQGNWHNGVTPWHRFFINVGVGSSEVDAMWPGANPPHPIGFLLDRRWEDLVPDAPYELRFNHTTDMAEFGSALCEGLEQVVEVFDEFDCTATLVGHAVESNLLIAYERTCCYLAAIDDDDVLTEYIGKLRASFGHQDRWEHFNRRIGEVTGAWTPELVRRGVLDTAVDAR